MTVAGIACASVLALAAPHAAHGVELVADGGFDDESLATWTPEAYDTSVIEWIDADATGDAGSGSLRLGKKIGETPNSVRVVPRRGIPREFP